MSRKDDFTAEQWQLLLDVPTLVGSTVMLSDKSGLGTVKEAFTLARGVMNVADTYKDNSLVKHLADARLQDHDRSQIEHWRNRFQRMSFDELLEETLRQCQQLSDLLSQKAAAAEAHEFKEWVLDIGQKVAEAAKEGGFMGIGGERVSQAETEVLNQIQRALGLTDEE